MSGTIMPAPVFTGLDDDGRVVSNGLLYAYESGTSTDADTWFEADLDASHLNSQPIELDGSGRAIVYLRPGSSYKFVLKDELGNQIWEVDPVSAVPASAGALVALATLGETAAPSDWLYLSDGSGGKTAGKWYKAQADQDYSSTLPEIATPLEAGDLDDVVSVALAGEVELSGPLTAGATYYVSPAAAGAITPAKPTGPGALARRVGQAKTALLLLMSANPPSQESTAVFDANNILANQVFS